MPSWKSHSATLLARRAARRPATTLLGVALAVATLFSVLAIHRGYQEGMRSELDRLGAQILVVPKGCPYDAASMALHGASWPCYLNAGYLSEVQATPGVAVAAPTADERGHGARRRAGGLRRAPSRTCWR